MESASDDQSSDSDSQVFIVEAIREHRVNRGKKQAQLEYLIKWEGYPEKENTWETEDNVFANELVVEYWESRGGLEARDEARKPKSKRKKRRQRRSNTDTNTTVDKSFSNPITHVPHLSPPQTGATDENYDMLLSESDEEVDILFDDETDVNNQALKNLPSEIHETAHSKLPTTIQDGRLDDDTSDSDSDYKDQDESKTFVKVDENQINDSTSEEEEYQDAMSFDEQDAVKPIPLAPPSKKRRSTWKISNIEEEGSPPPPPSPPPKRASRSQTRKKNRTPLVLEHDTDNSDDDEPLFDEVFDEPSPSLDLHHPKTLVPRALRDMCEDDMPESLFVIMNDQFPEDTSLDWEKEVAQIEYVVTRNDSHGKHAVVRWKKDDNLSLHPISLIHSKCPQKLIEYYEAVYIAELDR